DPETKQFSHEAHDPKNPFSLSSNLLSQIYQESSGAIWIGTYDTGLNRYDPAQYQFDSIQKNPFVTNTLVSNSLYTILTDRTKQLWIGSDGGLNQYDPLTKTFKKFVHEPNNPNSLSHNTVTALEEDSKGNIWIGTWTEGLNRYDSANQTFTRFPCTDVDHFNSIDSVLNNNIVRSILAANDGTIWVGVEQGGVNVLDPNTSMFHFYRSNPLDDFTVSGSDVRVLYQDSKDRIWVGTNHNGLNLFIPKYENFKRYPFNLNSRFSLKGGRVNCLLEDNGGKIWIGTNKGLNLLNPETDEFTFFDAPDQNIKAILQSDEKTLWLSTETGIACFHID
ncbi:hypothetical protein K8I31_12905, partial [bacterium]|nr:hypothetical protein [bacterium]